MEVVRKRTRVRYAIYVGDRFSGGRIVVSPFPIHGAEPKSRHRRGNLCGGSRGATAGGGRSSSYKYVSLHQAKNDIHQP